MKNNDVIDVGEYGRLEMSEQLPDGSTVYDFMDKEKDDFHSDLSRKMSEESLNKLSAYILAALEDDVKARDPWLKLHKDLMTFTGDKCDDISKENENSLVVDGTLGTALVRFTAIARAELLPESGPAGFKVFGQDSRSMEDIATNRSSWLNYYLTVRDEEYYKDYEKFLYYLGFYGTVIRKVCYDELLGMPISRFILPDNFLVNIDCSTIMDSNRLTHILKLSTRDILSRQKSGVFRDVELPYTKIDWTSDINNTTTDNSGGLVDINVYKERSLHDVYESHIDLDLDYYNEKRQSKTKDKKNRNILPYIVFIDKESRKILRIERNWHQSDKKQKRRRFFIGYQYYTGFDIWGQGIARMSANNAVAATKMLRLTIDSATYQNLPSGFYKGTKMDNTDIRLSPGTFKQLPSSAGGDIRSDFAILPFGGPSQALLDLRGDMISQMQDRLSASELGMMDSKEDIPTGTAVAFLEEKNRIQAAVLKSLHNSLSEELKLLDEMFAEVLVKEEFFIKGEKRIITADDFVADVQIVPVSDPSVNSTVQRIMKAEAVFQTAMQMPEKVDAFEALKMVFAAQGLSNEEIERLVTKEQEIEPADPITENMNLMQGKPVKAGIQQNHDAHIVVHSAVQNEQSAAHIQEHMALKFMLQMQNEMGIDLSQVPEDDQELQYELASRAAAAIEALGLNKVDQGEGEQSLDPNALLAADIEQKREENIIKKQIADDKIEAETFKTQMNFEIEKMKTKQAEEEAKLKYETEIQKISSRY
jgi:hypothetical protein